MVWSFHFSDVWVFLIERLVSRGIIVNLYRFSVEESIITVAISAPKVKACRNNPYGLTMKTVRSRVIMDDGSGSRID